MAMVSEVAPPTLFIVGCPRSGTTMLAHLLRHTSWGEGFETHFIPKYAQRLDEYGDLSDRVGFRRLMRDILSERPVQQWKLDLDIDEFRAGLTCHDYAHIVDALCALPSTRQGARSWCDKTPMYIFELDLIHRLFPDSKVIYLVRDGRDVALSLLARSWGPANVYDCALYWRQCYQPQAALESLRQRHLLLEVRYEDLLDEPESSLSRVLEFLGQDLDERQLSDMVQGVKRTNQGKWRTVMSAKEIRVFEQLARDTLGRFGYQTDHAEGEIGMLDVLRYRAQSKLKLAWHLFQVDVIDGIQIQFLGKEPFAE